MVYGNHTLLPSFLNYILGELKDYVVKTTIQGLASLLLLDHNLLEFLKSRDFGPC